LANDTVKINGQITLHDYLMAHWLHAGRSYVVAVAAIVTFSFLTYAFWLHSLLVLFISVGAALFFTLTVPLRLRRNFARYKALSVPYEIEITPEVLRHTSTIGSGEQRWEVFTKWKQSKDLILLYQSSMLFNVIPKHYFSSEQQISEFISFLEAQLGKAA